MEYLSLVLELAATIVLVALLLVINYRLGLLEQAVEELDTSIEDLYD